MRTRRTFQVTLDESRAFARLSGDWNPLHVDPVAARRLMFGSTVAHGIDVLIRTIGEAVRHERVGALATLSATFVAPLRTGLPATIEPAADDAADRSRVVYEVVSNGRLIQRVAMSFAAGPDVETGPALPASIAQAQPHARDFAALTDAKGSVPLALNPEIARTLYPETWYKLPPLQLAVLLATTRIVGMECPGLHSVYTELTLAFGTIDGTERPQLEYRVTKADHRFKFLTIEIDGGGARGQIGAMIRSAPVEQCAFAEVHARVSDNVFRDRRAIVIGGSRGLGEVTAKILAAGGADVTVTYATGASDGSRVAEEIRLGGGHCHAISFDVTAPPSERPSDVPAEWRPTDIFYFASPRITLKPGAAWDAALFERYCTFFVTGLVRSLAAVDAVFDTARQPLALFYPSSTFVSDPVSGAAEYAAAKAAGEALCRYLATTRPRLKVEMARLPRMLTDQTAGLKASRTKNPLDIMLDALTSGGGR